MASLLFVRIQLAAAARAPKAHDTREANQKESSANQESESNLSELVKREKTSQTGSLRAVAALI